MINYPLIIDTVRSDYFIDRTAFFETFCGRRYESLSNCSQTGSSMFLKTFACFLDKSIDTKALFQDLEIGKSEVFSKEVNSYRVLCMDFSDFHATDYTAAIEYLRDKMSDAYKCFCNHFEIENTAFHEYQPYEYVLDVIEKKSSEKDLQRSLRMLLLYLREYDVCDENCKLAVLIDNLVQLEMVAEECGYSKDMDSFLKDYIAEDVYNYCDLFLQIGDVIEDRETRVFGKRYLSYRYFSVIDSDIQTRYPELIVPKEQQYDFKYAPSVPSLFDWATYIDNGRKTIAHCKYQEEQKRMEHIRMEKERYAEKLSPNILKLSPNLGIREKHLNRGSSKYSELNSQLVNIYRHFYPNFTSEAIYNYLQKLNDRECIVSFTKELANVLEKLPVNNPRWGKPWVDTSMGYWVQVVYAIAKDTDCQLPGKPENVKIYASFSKTDIQKVFVDSLDYLLENAGDTFGAKIATCDRSDQMCYWLSVKDFKHLEEFYRPYSVGMVRSLPFVAYKGMLGISKDFPGTDDSHNATQAHIITDYLKTVHRIDDVDLEAMYNHYIAKWNADIYEERSYGGFKNNSALSFIVILDTLDAILNETGVSEDSLLLSDDKRLWKTLSNSRCWADVNEKWKE